MLPPEKIDEWIQEVDQRPTSAPIIIQYIANRLRDLTEWNEKLRAENIELRSGQRVEEYERTITHLEYQLELLKRQVSAESDLDIVPTDPEKINIHPPNMLVYGSGGRVARLEIDPDDLKEDGTLYRFDNLLLAGEEPPRILVVPPSSELMLIFTSGRVTTFPVAALPINNHQQAVIDWAASYVPEEPNLGEALAAIVPISQMALADFFLQVSRRGYIKKIRTALAATIMDNKFIGTGVKLPADQTMTMMMGHAEDCFIMVSHEGYLQCIPENLLPYAIVEAMHLGKTDHLVAAFPVQQEDLILVMTQVGKVVQRTADNLNTATDLGRKGYMLYSTARRKDGIRVIGAAAARPDDWAFALHQNGQVTMHLVSTLGGKGSIEVEGELLDFVIYQEN